VVGAFDAVDSLDGSEAVFGADALHIIQTEEIELAIVDSYLVDTNGLALAAEMKRLNPALAIIVLSASREVVGIANSWILKGSGAKELFAVQGLRPWRCGGI